MRSHRILRGRYGALALGPLALVPLASFALLAGPATTGAQETADSSRITPSKNAIRIGNRIVLRGQFEGASDARVRVERRPRGARNWQLARRTTTGPAGAYRVRIKPQGTARWRARLVARDQDDAVAAGFPATGAGVRATNAARVKVRSRTRARVANRHLTVGGQTRVAGTVRPAGRRPIVVRGGGRVVRSRTGANGRFSVRWPAGSVTRSHPIRVRAGVNRRAIGSRAGAGRVTVYRPAHASWYGPGFYGNRTACGQTLGVGTLGTAHRTLPCGTKVRLRHGGRSVTVRVIDRGPFIPGRELDLTYATKQRLGFGDTGNVLMSTG